MLVVSRCRQDNLILMSNSHVLEAHIHIWTCKSDLLYFKVQQPFLKGQQMFNVLILFHHKDEIMCIEFITVTSEVKSKRDPGLT